MLTRRVRSLAALGPLIAAGLALAGTGLGFAGYAPPVPAVPTIDTLRRETSEVAPAMAEAVLGAIIPGYLSFWGLPPVPGQFTITDSGLVFQAARGSASAQASTVSLAYVDEDREVRHYLFRVDAGVFETDAPGVLLQLAADTAWFRARAAGWRNTRMLLDASDTLAPLNATRRIAASVYADSLYSLFGQPRAPLGLIGRKGRSAGRLGEYIAGRDSLALDPSRMMDEAQLRHALAHELGHRWQARARAQLATLWSGVPAIRDPKRYGYGEQSEHQAEAIAFAINFLQTTAVTEESPATSMALLDHYDLLVPGTRTLVRYFALQPLYQQHPLRSLLTTGRVTSARAQ
ncbi:MAG TPA: hypothetical protein VE282_01280 [Gemmatimonadales bacterium]|jgi:hypothetical protein|nr:hypothetical protein [Gemmatimonadales bacterium]